MSLIKDWNPDKPETGFTRENHQYCCDYSITNVKNPDASAGSVLRFELNSSDQIVSSSKRAELQLSPGSLDSQKQKTYYGLRYWFEKYDSDGGAESILQWHDSDGSTPPLSIQVQNGRLNITQSFSTGNIHTDIGPVVIGKWVTIIIGVTWDEGTNGTLEVWRDTTKYIDKKGIRTNSKGGSYLKFGINKWSWAPGGGSSTATKRVFYIDQFRMGTSLADVTPGNVVIPPVNQSPVVNAGPDQTVKGDTVLLSGSVSDADGSIASVKWTGPGVITKPAVAATSVTGLQPGTYVFSLQATDNQGASSTDSVQVTVLTADTVPPPAIRTIVKQTAVVMSEFSDGTKENWINGVKQ